MATISLSKALKEKNRIAGELNKLRSIMSRENSRNVESASKVDRNLLYGSVKMKQAELVKIKTAIANSNTGINHLLTEMSELKSEAAWLMGLNTEDGTIKSRGYDSKEVDVKVLSAYFNQQNVDSMCMEITKRIDSLQDQVDAYNATTTIEI